jgi:hypothetical protein
VVVVAIVAAVIALHPPPFEVYVLDDIGQHVPEEVPGFAIATDRWAGHHGSLMQTRYLEAAAVAGETVEQAAQRLLPALPRLPADRRFLLKRGDGRWFVYEAFARRVVGTLDVVSAELAQDGTLAPDDVSVRLRFTPAAAEKFAAASAAAVHHRMAIVVDAAIETAPVVMSRIPGGVITIAFGKGADRLSRGRRLISDLARAAVRPVPAEALKLPLDRAWTRIVDPGRFEALLPGETWRRVRDGQIASTTYGADFGGLTLSVGWDRKRGSHPLADAAELQAHLFGEKGFRIERQGSLTLSGHPGLALRARSAHALGWTMRLYETGDRLYVLYVLGRDDELDGALTRKFFDSFHITE